MSFTPQELKSIMGSGLLSFPVTDFDAQGNFDRAGYVKRLVPLVVPQSGPPAVAGMPIDLELATGSAALRGMAIGTRPALTAFFAAQDVAHCYEIRLQGDPFLLEIGHLLHGVVPPNPTIDRPHRPMQPFLQ